MYHVKKFNFAACLLAVAAFSGCTTSSTGSSTSVPPLPQDDDAYITVLKKWTREAHVYRDFQKQIDVSAVLLTDEMRRAYATRWKGLRGEAKSMVEESGGKTGIFISMFTPDRPYSALDDAKMWTLETSSGDNVAKLIQVKTLVEKAYYDPFFPFMNQWSTEYLAIFDDLPTGLGNTVVPTSVTLKMKSALVSVTLEWK